MILSERYNRQINLSNFGSKGQEKLQQAKVLVVGAGGLGIPVLQYLTAMGVGTIGIVDGDVISLSNLNRQVLYKESDVGKSKVAVATESLRVLNSSVNLIPVSGFLTVDNALALIDAYDLVVDATDNIPTRYIINDACVILHKPFVYGAIFQYEGHVSVFNLGEGPTYRCLYPVYPTNAEVPDCNTAGVLGIVPGIIGCEQALEAVKVLTGIGERSSGYLRIFDFLNNDQYKVKLKTKPENKQISQLKDYYGEPGCEHVLKMEPEHLLDWINSKNSFSLIDVREADEFTNSHLSPAELIPLTQLEKRTHEIGLDKPVVTVCQKGGRSLQAASIIKKANPNISVYTLNGGMDKWQQNLGNKLIVA